MNLFDLCVYKNLNKGSGGDVDVSSLVATENKTYNAGEGKAYNPVVVNVPTPPPSLQSLTASHNGYFVPSSGYVGFSEVNVDVALPQNAYLLESQKDDVVTIQHGAEFDMPKLIASIEPQQSGSGDPSPENIRPISGWTACNVAHCGKNEWGSLPTEYTIGYQGNIIQYSDFPIGAGTYKFIFDTDTPKGQMQLEIFKNNSWQTTDRVYDSGGFNVESHNELTVTLSESANRLRLFTNSSNGISIKNVKMLDMAHTYTINFVDGSSPLTVYGGTLNVLSGLLTITDGYISSYNGETLPSTWISDRDVYAEGTTPTTGAEVCYKLATPQTYQLTPTEVKSLLGVNNIFADTGEVDVQIWTKEVTS